MAAILRLPRTNMNGLRLGLGFIFRLPLLAVGALLAALFSALAVMPARWLMRVPDPGWPIAIIDATGTVWDGTALLAVGPPGARRTVPEPVAWHWGWQGIDVRHAWLAGPLHLTPGWRGVAVSAQSLRLPADMLAALGAPLNTLAPGGQIEMKWQAYAPGVSAAGPLLDAQWRDATSSLSTVRPLGSYLLRVTRTGKGGLSLALSTQSGALRLQAAGAWNGKRLSLNGTAQAAADASDGTRMALNGLLSAIGRRSNDDQSVFGTDLPP